LRIAKPEFALPVNQAKQRVNDGRVKTMDATRKVSGAWLGLSMFLPQGMGELDV